MTDHTKLIIWQRSHALAVRIHAMRLVERNAPGLSNQLKRSCASIASNIAEGAGYSSRSQFAHYIETAIATNRETQNHLELALDTKSLDEVKAVEAIEECIEIRRMLYGFLKRLRGPEPARRGGKSEN